MRADIAKPGDDDPFGNDAGMPNDEARARLATSCLAHILIALEADDRGAPFRDFLDNWHAYEKGGGHLTSGGRPVWFNNPCAKRHRTALSAMHFVSGDAAAILANAREGKVKASCAEPRTG